MVGLWAEVGIEAEIEPIAPGTEVPPVLNDEFQAIQWAQFGTPDPDIDYIFFHSSSGALNWTNLQSDKLDEGLDLARSTTDPEVRAEGYTLVQEAFAEEVPIIWYDHLANVQAIISAPPVQGIAEASMPDGTPRLAFINGTFFSWEDVWLAS